MESSKVGKQYQRENLIFHNPNTLIPTLKEWLKPKVFYLDKMRAGREYNVEIRIFSFDQFLNLLPNLSLQLQRFVQIRPLFLSMMNYSSLDELMMKVIPIKRTICDQNALL